MLSTNECNWSLIPTVLEGMTPMIRKNIHDKEGNTMKRTLASSFAHMSIIIRIYVIIKGRKQLIIDSFLMSVIKVAS